MCVSLEDFTKGQAIGYIGNLMDIGDEFTVRAECIGYGKNDCEIPCYELAGFVNVAFDQRNFSVLPEDSADDMDAADHEAIVPNPINELP